MKRRLIWNETKMQKIRQRLWMLLGVVSSSLVAVPASAENCVDAYEHDHYQGANYHFCTGTGPALEQWNDRISSLKVPANTKATFCTDVQDGKGTGLCRTYFSDMEFVGVLNDTFSFAQVQAFDPNDFTMAILSDIQYGFCEAAACKSGPGSSEQANTWQSASVQSLASSLGDHFAGVIVNGDLTNSMDRGQIESYMHDYEGKGFNLYPGLGNHDYQNYIEDKRCDGWGMLGGAYNAWSQNYCAVRLLEFVVNRIQSIPSIRTDITFAGTWPNMSTEGSLAYSFDIGTYHFAQINNHPSYHRDFASYVSSHARWEAYSIRKSFTWLEDDLAKSKDKPVILNLHVMNADDFAPTVGGSCTQECADDYKLLGTILDKNPQVVAIFAGHLHEAFSAEASFATPGGRKVPILFSGASEMNKYLKVRFQKESLTVEVVDSANGGVKDAGIKPRVIKSTIEAPKTQPITHEFVARFENVDDDVYLSVNGQQQYYSKARNPDPVALSSWLTQGDNEIDILLGNGGCFATSLDFTLTRDDIIVDQHGYHPWGWQHCGWQLLWKYQVNPVTGVWKRLN